MMTQTLFNTTRAISYFILEKIPDIDVNEWLI